jgi:hypothetical protein
LQIKFNASFLLHLVRIPLHSTSVRQIILAASFI